MGNHPLNSELRAVTPWWEHVLGGVDVRRAMTPGPSPVLVYGDASGCGHLGVAIVADGISTRLRAHVPERMIAAHRDIIDLESAESLGVWVVSAGGFYFWVRVRSWRFLTQ